MIQTFLEQKKCFGPKILFKLNFFCTKSKVLKLEFDTEDQVLSNVRCGGNLGSKGIKGAAKIWSQTGHFFVIGKTGTNKITTLAIVGLDF